jgi:fatty acid desaturase
MTPDVRGEAVQRLRKKQDLRAHVLVYILVNAVTWAIWALASPGGFAWPLLLTGVWGIGLVMNVFDVYGRRPFTEAQIRAEVDRLERGAQA